MKAFARRIFNERQRYVHREDDFFYGFFSIYDWPPRCVKRLCRRPKYVRPSAPMPHAYKESGEWQKARPRMKISAGMVEDF